jgi:glycosyltransferase involved in cell wall biosynthesis
MSTEPIYLSIIIPAYNEEQRLSKTLPRVAEYLQQQTYSYEVIVVENGSTDNTLQVAQKVSGQFPFIKIIKEEESGKGLAVRTGMLAATGQYRFMCDADLSMPIEEVYRFLPPQLEDADIVIGSREAPGATRYNEPGHRHWGGRLVNLVIRLLALPGLRDTQCGFKSFTSTAAQDLFFSQTLFGWSFDIEILFVARRRGYSVAEIGIPWYYSDLSHVNPLRDAFQMILDIFKIRMNALTGRYRRK